ncbi:unnamed protein product, partial [Pylaiella littoralis]
MQMVTGSTHGPEIDQNSTAGKVDQHQDAPPLLSRRAATADAVKPMIDTKDPRRSNLGGANIFSSTNNGSTIAAAAATSTT